MRVFAIGDLHLSLAQPKPMDIFGTHWSDHWSRIRENWAVIGISDDDLVLIPGDISWAMNLRDAAMDLSSIGELPGVKVFIRGNHDYWWNSLSKVRSALPRSAYAIQNDALRFPGAVVCGTRGWTCPGSAGFAQEDNKLYLRELIRMEMSLKEAEKAACRRRQADRHDPFSALQRTQRTLRVHGTLRAVRSRPCRVRPPHGRSCRTAFEGSLNGVDYILTSCDHLALVPRLVTTV
jgi:predicted phosphohydrolase